MNLHGIVRGPIRAVNPDIAAQYLKSTGYTTGPDGKRVPSYAPPVNLTLQVQGVSELDISRLNGLGIQGVVRKVFDYGNRAGIIRIDGKGGDIFKFPQVPGGPIQTWFLTSVGETWADWSAFIVTLQTV